MSFELKDVNKHYDERMYADDANIYYEDCGFHNWGYWTKDISTQKEASENLVKKLVSLILNKKGNILDVACGMGATTKYLLEFYDASNVTGINISKKQLDTCKEKVPDCKFLLMDAAKLEFEDNSFDNILCVEAAFHFTTREAFLKEAFRVLKPGGQIVLSDLSCSKGARKISFIPETNHIPSIANYKDLLRNTGFDGINIIDATKECWRGFDSSIKRAIQKKYEDGELSYIARTIAILFRKLTVKSVYYYILVSCRKP